MTDDEIPRDISLLKCTFKKSRQVIQKIIEYLIKTIIYGVILAGVIAGLSIIYMIYINFSSYGVMLFDMFIGLLSVFTLIPWWVYTIMGAIAAIPVYSFLWCLNRDMTEEDKKVDIDHPIMRVSIFGGGFIGVLIGGYNGWIFGYNLFGSDNMYHTATAWGVVCCTFGAILAGLVCSLLGCLIGVTCVTFYQYYLRKKGDRNDKPQNE